MNETMTKSKTDSKVNSSPRYLQTRVMGDEVTNSGRLSPEKIKDAIENPDLMTRGCKEHLFHIKGDIIVYSELMVNSNEGYEVICANILVKPKSS